MVRFPARLTEAERDRIRAAVAAAEKRTGAEFVLAVAQASDSYAMYPLAWAGVIALALGGVLAVALPELDLRTGFAAQSVAFILLGLLLHWLPLRLLLVPGRVKHREAEELARTEFGRLVLGRTPGSLGVLLFASLGERFVEILPDRGIAALIPESRWRAIVDGFVAALAAGRAAEGFIGAVEACAAVLEKEFPPCPGAGDVLSNSIVEIGR